MDQPQAPFSRKKPQSQAGPARAPAIFTKRRAPGGPLLCGLPPAALCNSSDQLGLF